MTAYWKPCTADHWKPCLGLDEIWVMYCKGMFCCMASDWGKYTVCVDKCVNS